MCLLMAPTARAQFAVIDVGAITQLIAQVELLQDQLTTAPGPPGASAAGICQQSRVVAAWSSFLEELHATIFRRVGPICRP